MFCPKPNCDYEVQQLVSLRSLVLSLTTTLRTNLGTDAVISTPRRFGKTVLLSCLLACIALHVPIARIGIFACSARQSDKNDGMIGIIRDILILLGQTKFRVDAQDHLFFMRDGTERQIRAYPVCLANLYVCRNELTIVPTGRHRFVSIPFFILSILYIFPLLGILLLFIHQSGEPSFLGSEFPRFFV